MEKIQNNNLEEKNATKEKNEHSKVTNWLEVDWIDEEEILKILDDWLKSNKNFNEIKKTIEDAARNTLSTQDYYNSIFVKDPERASRYIDQTIISWMCRNQNQWPINDLIKESFVWLANTKNKAWENHYKHIIKNIIAIHPDLFSKINEIWKNEKVDKFKEWLDKFIKTWHNTSNNKIAEFFSNFEEKNDIEKLEKLFADWEKKLDNI